MLARLRLMQKGRCQ
ncbi:hypothetical protein [Escherichia coli]|nr:hypothetical protein [Escherichia coli]